MCLLSFRSVGMPQDSGATFFMHLIYFHCKADTHEIFYVGQSKTLRRANSSRGRNFLWHRTKNKHGFYVKIFRVGLTKAEVDLLEIAFIKQFGRIDNGTGILVNRTDGADGTNGVLDSPETRLKKSISHLGKKATIEQRLRISLALTGIKKNLTKDQRKAISDRVKVRNTGRIKSASEIEKLRLTKIGKPRPDWVRKKVSESKKKPVILTKETSILELKSVTDAAIFLSCSRKEICTSIKHNKDYKGFRIYHL